jgi:hypothetical protein
VSYINVIPPWPGLPKDEYSDPFPRHESIPESLYHYVEHLKKAWPERKRFEIKMAVSAQCRESAKKGLFDAIDDGLYRQAYTVVSKIGHSILSMELEWRPDQASHVFPFEHGPWMYHRVAYGWSVPRPEGIDFLR